MNFGIDLMKSGREDHKWIKTTGLPVKAATTDACVLIMNQYSKRNWSAKKWRNETQMLNVSYSDHNQRVHRSADFNYRTISEMIREKGGFDPALIGLPELYPMWLDHATEMKINFHMCDKTGAFVLESGDLQSHYYGSNYPIRPRLDREGKLYTSIQPQLIRRIIKDRDLLIENSQNGLSDDWIFDMRNLISNTISLVDIAFTQLYIKAEYDPLPGWAFDREQLGERHARRLKDKFKWVRKISGNEFNAEAEMKSIDTLRVLRNHLMHFDPPSLAITMEEAAGWLNQIIDVAFFLIKFRKTLGVDVSSALINFSLQKEAIFVPFSNDPRLDIKDAGNANYPSSAWPANPQI